MCVIKNLNGEEMFGTNYKNELQKKKKKKKKKIRLQSWKSNQEIRLYVKWKGYDNYSNR